MTAAAPLWQVPEPSGAGFGLRLADARAAVSDLAIGTDGLADVADDDVLAVMGELTSIAAQIDGLRVATAAAVRERDLARRQGARNVASWLRADPRTADDAWKISQLAAAADRLPKILALLCAGEISLTQAGAACWQVSHLPTAPVRPQEAPDPASTDTPAGTDERDGDRDGTGDQDGSSDQDGAGDRDAESRWQRNPDEAWAGMWRAGDVHAAADELFSRFLPSLDASQVRAMGTHLREAADAQERAGEDYDDYAKRRLRISRTFGDAAEISGRLHAEAAEQVIAAFEDLGVKYGPDDTRTKTQRWADVLTGLTAGTGPTGAAGPAAGTGPTGAAGPAAGTGPQGQPGRPDDNQPGPDGEHLHGHPGLGGSSADPAIPPGLRRPRLIVLVPLSTTLGGPLSPGGILGSGTPITGEAARRLGCDAEIVRLITSSPPGCTPSHGYGDGEVDGQIRQGLDTTGRLTALLAEAIAALPRPLSGPSAILDAGRKHPGWTPRQRDALHAQYGGHCSAPRCKGPIDVIHHVIHWTEGGLTSVINGAPVCNYHHWLVHEGGWRMKKYPDGTITLFPPPPGWRPGTIYRRGKPIRAG